jgi:hypothetical protein
MAKNLSLRVASKLFAINKYRDISVMLEELFDIGDDCLDFLFAHDCELTEKQIWTKEFLVLLREEIDKRLQNDNIGKI